MSAVSVLILTLDEELNLPNCLESVEWCDDIVVYDSFSTDRTVAIAEAAGARVVRREFDDYASQRNAALHGVPFRHPWVLMLDADERVTPDLHREIEARVAQVGDDTTLLFIRRKDFFFGRWLRRSSGYPTWFGRLVKPTRVAVSRAVNEEYHANGEVGFLRHHLVHYPFNKGISHWYAKHNHYSTLEATTLVEERLDPLRLTLLFSPNPQLRRKGLKQVAYRLPGRPAIVFLYLYLARLGFLDGIPGLTYAMLRGYYEMSINLKIRELKHRSAGLSV